MSASSTPSPMDAVDVFTRAAIDAFMLFYASFALFFWLLWRKQQPLKSKTYIPPTLNMQLIIAMVVALVLRFLYYHQVVAEDHTPTVFVILDYSAYVNTVYAFGVHSFRFLILQNLSNAQENFLSQANKNTNDTASSQSALGISHSPPSAASGSSNFSKQLKFYKFLLSVRFRFIILAPIFIICLIIPTVIVLLIYLVPGFKAKHYMEIVRAACLGVLTFIAILAMVILFIIDMVRNRGLLLHFYQYFITKDRLLFRFDLVVGSIGAILSIITIAYTTLNPYARLAIGVVRIICVIGCLGGANSIWYLFILKSSVICFSKRKLGIKNDASSFSSSTVMSEQMYNFISFKQGYEGFREFVKGEFSLENLECWTTIQRLKQTSEVEERSKLYAYLYNTFVSDNSLMQTNLVQNTKQECLKKYNLLLKYNQDKHTHLEEWKVVCMDPNFVKSLETEMCMNLNDSFSRYNKTHSYRQVLSLMEQMKSHFV